MVSRCLVITSRTQSVHCVLYADVHNDMDMKVVTVPNYTLQEARPDQEVRLLGP